MYTSPVAFSRIFRLFSIFLLPMIAAWSLMTACPAPNATPDGSTETTPDGSTETTPDGSTQETMSEATPEGSGAIRSLVTKEGTYRVVYVPAPDPIPLNENFAINFTVTYADGREMALPADLELKADATMPAHKHGMLQKPTIQKETTGKYKVDGMKFHMPGQWVMKVDLTSGAKTETVDFEINLSN
ncbi:FixH family protein [Myxococcota bacterium]|nr:FixH family protein [Myxococcota bacterium]